MDTKTGMVKFLYDGKAEFPVSTRSYACVKAEEGVSVPPSPFVNRGDEEAVDVKMRLSKKGQARRASMEGGIDMAALGEVLKTKGQPLQK
eukprot:1668036-Rhodomonas_salina.1